MTFVMRKIIKIIWGIAALAPILYLGIYIIIQKFFK